MYCCYAQIISFHSVWQVCSSINDHQNSKWNVISPGSIKYGCFCTYLVLHMNPKKYHLIYWLISTSIKKHISSQFWFCCTLKKTCIFCFSEILTLVDGIDLITMLTCPETCQIFGDSVDHINVCCSRGCAISCLVP